MGSPQAKLRLFDLNKPEAEADSIDGHSALIKVIKREAACSKAAEGPTETWARLPLPG